MGRTPELATLRRHLDATQAGSGRVVLVEGEPGLGKTRLAEMVATEAASRGFRALWGRCFEGDGAPPFWPWTQVLRQTHDARDLTALVPERDQLDPQVARAHLNQALTDLLRGLAEARPLLVVLDDLHWADVASLQLLEFLAANLIDARILVLAAYREVDLALSERLTDTLGHARRARPPARGRPRGAAGLELGRGRADDPRAHGSRTRSRTGRVGAPADRGQPVLRDRAAALEGSAPPDERPGPGGGA